MLDLLQSRFQCVPVGCPMPVSELRPRSVQEKRGVFYSIVVTRFISTNAKDISRLRLSGLLCLLFVSIRPFLVQSTCQDTVFELY